MVEFKFSPIFATAYATAFLLRVSIISLWPQLLMLLIALRQRAYVSVINDLTILDTIRRVVKRTAPWKVASVLTTLLACWHFVGDRSGNLLAQRAYTTTLYLASWSVFTLYSLPPVRLKKRGVSGCWADASGAHLFPTLLAVALCIQPACGAAG